MKREDEGGSGSKLEKTWIGRISAKPQISRLGDCRLPLFTLQLPLFLLFFLASAAEGGLSIFA